MRRGKREAVTRTRIAEEEWKLEGKAGVPPVVEPPERSHHARAFYARQLRRYRWHNGTSTPKADRVRIQQCYDAPGDALAERARVLRTVYVDVETVELVRLDVHRTEHATLVELFEVAPPWADATKIVGCFCNTPDCEHKRSG